MVDFTYFVNNNPREVEILGGELPSGQPSLVDVNWQVIVPRTFVKPYRGNKIVFPITTTSSGHGLLPAKVSVLLIRVFPDGGLNRVRALSMASPALLDEIATLGLRRCS